MSEYVQITSSVADIMTIAGRISQRGLDLKGRIAHLNQAIVDHDNRDECYPSDQFSDPFTAQYLQPTTGADGDPSTAAEAVRSSATYCGTKLGEIGDYVGRAMMNYGATDDDSAADINRTGA